MSEITRYLYLFVFIIQLVYSASDIYIAGDFNHPIACRDVDAKYRLYLYEENSKLTGNVIVEVSRCRLDSFVRLADCIRLSGGSCQKKCKEATESELRSLLYQETETIVGSVNGNIIDDKVIASAQISELGTIRITGTVIEDNVTGKITFSANFKSDFTCEPNVYVDGSMSGTGIKRERGVKTKIIEENIIIAGQFNTPYDCKNFPIQYTLTLNKKGNNVTGSFYGEAWKCSVGDVCKAYKCKFDLSSQHCIPDPIINSEAVRDSLIIKRFETVSGEVSGTIQGGSTNLVIRTSFGDLFLLGDFSQNPENGKILFSGVINSQVTCEPGVYIKGSVSGNGLVNEVTKKINKIGDSCDEVNKCDEGICVNNICVKEPKCNPAIQISCGPNCCGLTQSCLNDFCSPEFCRSGLIQCGLTCINASRDRFNCGSCGNLCGENESCIGGKCVSINLLLIDRENCGEKGKICAENEVCSDGNCISCSGLERCGNRCVNLSTDQNNCGSCGNSCSTNEFCQNGECIKSSSCVFNIIKYIQCGKNCCDFPQWCDTESMSCMPPLQQPREMENPAQCGKDIVDLSVNRDNCGLCFNKCNFDEDCINGKCEKIEICGNGVCGKNESCSTCSADCGSCIETGCTPDYPNLCEEKCVNIINDSKNCGSCGNICNLDQICRDGRCIGVINSECQNNDDCLYGYCRNNSCQLKNCISDSDCNYDEHCNLNLGICDSGCSFNPDSCKTIAGENSFCDSNISSDTYRECLVCPTNSVPDGKGGCICTGENCDPDLKPIRFSEKKTPSPLSIFIEEERQAAADLLFSVFNISKQRMLAYETCLRGSLCTSSNDCCGAPCMDSRCACSVSVCAVTADCCNGYCENGKCLSPPATSLFFKGLSMQMGCSGLIEECTPGEKNCISLCNGLTFLLLFTAGGFGAFMWLKYKHPVAGLVSTFAPIIIGIATYPFAGIIITLIVFSFVISKSIEGIKD